MIEPLKYQRALAALHLVICHARTMALMGEELARIARVLDWPELLPQYLADDDDKTREFGTTLEALAEIEPKLNDAVNAFNDAQPAIR